MKNILILFFTVVIFSNCQQSSIDELHAQNQILDSKEKEFEIKSNFDMGFLMELFTSVMSKKKDFKLISPKFIIATSSVKVKDFKKEINKGKFSIYIM